VTPPENEPADRGESVLDRFARWLPVACRSVVWISAVMMNAPIVWHVARGSRAHLGFFADDFFYYTVVADRFVSSGHLTFDGVHPTNGFHPLWFAILALIRLLSGGVGGAFYVVLAVVDALLAVVTFEVYVRLGRAIGVRRSIAFVCAAFMVVPLNEFFADAMETNVAVPLSAALLLAVARTNELLPRRAAAIGLLSSLVVLARLDLVILVALMVAGWAFCARESFAAKGRAALAFGAGGLLFPIYCAFNVLAFGALLPTSAAAKQMSTSFGVNVDFLRLVFDFDIGREGVLTSLLALVLLFTRWSRTSARPARFAVVLAIAFPVVYYTVCALRSPWRCFPWYAYALYAPLFLSLSSLSEAFAARVKSPRFAWVACILAVAVLGRVPVLSARFARHYAFQWEIEDNLITANAFELARRLSDRTGVYAMGDKAGNVANVLGHPIVQLEGLVADPAMLDRIRAQEPLGEVLRAYGVDYLIVSIGPNVPLPKVGDCYEISQPNAHEAGDRSPKMRGRLCGEPIVDYVVPRARHWWSKYNFPIHSYVFDLRQAEWQPPPT
jgi:hypothetical protein